MTFNPIPQYINFANSINELQQEEQMFHDKLKHEIPHIVKLNNEVQTKISKVSYFDWAMLQFTSSKLFGIEKNICEAIKKTKVSEVSEFPFSWIILIPEQIEIAGNKIEGIWIRKIHYELYYDKNTRQFEEALYINKTKTSSPFIRIIYELTDKEGWGHIRQEYIGLPPNFILPKLNMSGAKNTFHYKKEIFSFIKGLLNFINNPEIEIIERKTANKRNEKRANKNKAPIPDRNYIKITGKLKKYLENFEAQANKYGYSHRFWVRGHFRTLGSEKFTNKQGQKIWIVPYIKGQGILINKKYAVAKTDNENEVKQ